MSYDNFKTIAENCIDAWRSRSQQFDGSWVFTGQNYDNTGFHLVQDAAIDTNGMMLLALVSLARLEAAEGNSVKAADYAGAAGKIANWLLARQELNPSSPAYGGFYNDVGSQTLYLDANARAVIGLLYFAFSIDTLGLSTYYSQQQLTQRLVLWAEQFVARYHDAWWGPYWTVDGGGVTNYPKFTYSAAELGLAMTGISVLDSNPNYQNVSTNFYSWYTGDNEFGTDFQFVLPKPRLYVYEPTPRAFSLGIDFNASQTLVVSPDSNLETNAEVLQHLLALTQPTVTWSLPASNLSQPPQQQCVIATAAYGSEYAQPVQFLRDFRDQDVNRTYLGHGFLVAFNAWYYSWSPSVASIEARNEELRAAVRAAILPLLGTLFISSEVFNLLHAVNSELAVLITGVFAGFLLGSIYLTPVGLVILGITKRRVTQKSLAYVAIGGVALTLLGTIGHGTTGIIENLTALIVVEAVLLGSALWLRLMTTIEVGSNG